MKTFQKMKDLVNLIEVDAEKIFNKANGAAGTRVRKVMLEVKALAGDIRKEITEKKKSK